MVSHSSPHSRAASAGSTHVSPKGTNADEPNIGIIVFGGTFFMGRKSKTDPHLLVQYGPDHLYGAAAIMGLKGDSLPSRSHAQGGKDDAAGRLTIPLADSEMITTSGELLQELVSCKLAAEDSPPGEAQHRLQSLLTRLKGAIDLPRLGPSIAWIEKGFKWKQKSETGKGYELMRDFLPIDSIDFRFNSEEPQTDRPPSEHEGTRDYFKILLHQARRYFTDTKNHPPGPQNLLLFCGTDSLSIYGPMLTMALQQEGFLQPGSGQRIIFITSMKSFEEAPKQAARIFQAATSLAAADKAPEGGLVLSPKTPGADIFSVHDITHGFTKYSAHKNDAFASIEPVGTLTRIDGKTGVHQFQLNPAYHRPKVESPAVEPGKTMLGRVAPALIRGNNLRAHIAYLQQFLKRGEQWPDGEPVDALVFEGKPYPEHNNPEDRQAFHAFQALIHQAAEKGIACVFVNSKLYEPQEADMRTPGMPAPFKSAVEPDSWRRSSDLTQAGAIMLDNMTLNHAITYTMLHTGRARAADAKGPEKIKAAFGNRFHEREFYQFQPADNDFIRRPYHTKDQKIPAIGLHYFPDLDMFPYGVDVAAEIAKKIVFSALPGGAMASAFTPLLSRIKKASDVKMGVGFAYAGYEYEPGEVEQVKSDVAYDAGTPCLKIMDFTCGKKPPSQFIAAELRQNPKPVGPADLY